MRISLVIFELHNGQLGSSTKLNDSLIHPLQSSPVQAHTFVSTSGTGSFGPREKVMNASPFLVYLPLYFFSDSKERRQKLKTNSVYH